MTETLTKKQALESVKDIESRMEVLRTNISGLLADMGDPLGIAHGTDAYEFRQSMNMVKGFIGDAMNMLGYVMSNVLKEDKK